MGRLTESAPDYIEAMAMLSKGQVRFVPANDMPAQRALVHRVFGVAA